MWMALGIYINRQDRRSLDLVVASGIRIFGAWGIEGLWFGVCGSIQFDLALVSLSRYRNRENQCKG